MEIADRQCLPCRSGTPPLTAAEINQLLSLLKDGWIVCDNHHLERQLKFPDFKRALDFANKIGEIAEAQAHHPDLSISWGKVVIRLWTHKIGGLSENDFILAAKIDRL